MKISLVILRILYTLLLLGMIVFLPWYFVVGGVLVGMFLFPLFIEGFIVMVLLDGLYGFSGSTPQIGTYSVVGMVSLVVIKYLKKHLTWYS